MSYTVNKYNWLLILIKRSYSAQAVNKTSNFFDIDVRTTTKNIRVVSVNENSPLKKVSYSFKAGSRYELSDTLGITHVLRSAIGLSTKSYTPFNIHRNTVQNGFNLYSSLDREAFTITIETHSNKLQVALSYLHSVATEPVFKPWEIEDNRERIKLDLSLIPPEAKVLDLLHHVAYRNGLGNSLFIETSRVNKFNYEHCLQFFNEHFTAKRLQVTSAGVDAKILELLANTLETKDGPQTKKSNYYGGELRINNYKQHVSYVGIAGEATSYLKKDYPSYAVLQYVYANSPSIKYGSGVGILNKALTKVGVLGAVNGFNASFSDSGLVGFLLVANSSDIVKAYDVVLNSFLKSEITDEDVVRGKMLAKANILNNIDNASSAVDFFSKQVGVNPLITPLELANAVNSVTTADVKQAAKKLVDRKLTVVSYGDVADLPYVDTIKK